MSGVPRRLPPGVARLRGYVATGLRSGFPYALISVLSVQGATFLMQLLASRSLTPADFGLLRSLEAILGVLVIAGCLGMPSLAIKVAAEVASAQMGRLVKKLLALGAGMSVLVAAVVAAVCALRDDSLSSQLTIFIWIIVLTNSARIVVNFFLGLKQVRTVSLATSAVAVVTVALVTTGVSYSGLSGWVWGRLAGEALLLVTVIYCLRRVLQGNAALSERHSVATLLSAGAPIALGLFTRSAVDNAPIIALNLATISHEDIGMFGLATLLTAPILLLPAVAASLSIPYFVQRLPQPDAFQMMFRRAVGLTFVTAAGLALGAVIAIHFLLAIFAETYRASEQIFLILAIAIPFRAVATQCGTVLLTLNANYSALILNVFEGGALTIALFSLVPSHGIAGAAWAMTSAALLSGSFFYYVAQMRARHIRPTANTPDV